MKNRVALVVLLCLWVCVFVVISPAQEHHKQHLYLCRSPLLAFDFWRDLNEMGQKGVTITPAIAEQLCNGMKAGQSPQCIRVEADEFKPIASGSAGAMEMTDGKTKAWFHDPDSGGWIHPDYYIYYLNHK